MLKFGTDGIRGEVGKDLTFVSAMHVGSALSKLKKNMKVIIGRDNRPSGNTILLAVSIGLMLGGASVVDVGVSTTPCISYLTNKLNFDYGVEISASHNPANYNGIKIFDSFGEKIDCICEKQIEDNLDKILFEDFNNIGKVTYCPKLKEQYISFLLKFLSHFDKKIAIDCANGSATKFVKKIFKNNKKVLFMGTGTGKCINKSVGATNANSIFEFVKKNNLDVGFAFDGDADRIVVATKKQIYTGDNILLALSRLIKSNCIVGTILSNLGVEKVFKSQNILFKRADVGDKNVLKSMKQFGATLGGEPAGHIICKNFEPTGDGLLICLLLLKIFANQDVDEIMHFDKVAQIQKNVFVKKKEQVLLNENIINVIRVSKQILEDGRIVVRPSGTENVIRIMIESNNPLALKIENIIENKIKEIDEKCVE